MFRAIVVLTQVSMEHGEPLVPVNESDHSASICIVQCITLQNNIYGKLDTKKIDLLYCINLWPSCDSTALQYDVQWDIIDFFCNEYLF